jgi:hypothetical protein
MISVGRVLVEALAMLELSDSLLGIDVSSCPNQQMPVPASSGRKELVSWGQFRVGTIDPQCSRMLEKSSIVLRGLALWNWDLQSTGA